MHHSKQGIKRKLLDETEMKNTQSKSDLHHFFDDLEFRFPLAVDVAVHVIIIVVFICEV